MANIKPFFGNWGFGAMDRWDPANSFGFGDFFKNRFDLMKNPFDALGGSFRVDIRDAGDKYEIQADLPGLHREMIKLEVQDGVLTISADMDQAIETQKDDYVIHERRQGTVSRSFGISDVKEEEITANYANGVLTVILPKGTDDDAKKRVISVD